MCARPRRHLASSCLLALGLVLGGAHPAAQAPPATPPLVFSATVDSIIHPVSAEYMIRAIERADREHAALLVFTLRTPGGLVDSTRAIVTRMVAARTPIAVYVAPAGARAASAGFILLIAADVAAMAPGTHIGAAHPVGGNGQKLDDTMAAKTTEDVAAYVRTLAGRRGRNVDLAAEAVTKSRAFTETEARAATPALVDLVAPDVTDLLRQLEGRTITRFDGTTTVLHLDAARVEAIAMTRRQRVLSAVAHPDIAYLLLSLGTLALTIELWNPGAVLPGVVGGVCLLLAFFAFSVLPTNYAGLLLIAFGLALLALEIKVTSYGLLSAGGVVSLLFGSMILVDSPLPEFQLRLSLVAAVAAGFGAIGLLLARLAYVAQRRPARSGSSGMVGETGLAQTAIAPGAPGLVATHGEIWRATADRTIPPGSRVRVTHVDGLRLTVSPD
jgi:membrane-bound serine protease (ClpP class)